MGISAGQGIGSVKAGVCTSTTRPSNPYEGQQIYETDTDKVLVWNGSAWYANWNTAWGTMQRVSSTGTTTAGATEAVTLTLPSFTAVANRYYRITYFEPYFETISANGLIIAKIRMTNISGATIAMAAVFQATAGGEGQVQAIFMNTLTAGATVVVATIQSLTSSTYMYGSAEYNRLLWVEDIGPA